MWVRRNARVPYRCPRCHAIRRRTPFGPRTTVQCEPCGVRWKIGRGNRWPKIRYRSDLRFEAVLDAILAHTSLATPRARAVAALTPLGLAEELTERADRARAARVSPGGRLPPDTVSSEVIH